MQSKQASLSNSLSRRDFLRASRQWAKGSFIVLSAPSILAACQRAEEVMQAPESAEFIKLTELEATEMAAVAARIIPSDDSPGANEAGVIYFIDTVMADDREAEYAQLQEALESLRQQAASDYGVNRFAELGEAQQDELLTSIENTPFFQTMRFLTIAGMFSLPAYGGNRNAVGYELIGFQSQHAWAAPYGYYDADYMEKGA